MSFLSKIIEEMGSKMFLLGIAMGFLSSFYIIQTYMTGLEVIPIMVLVPGMCALIISVLATIVAMIRLLAKTRIRIEVKE